MNIGDNIIDSRDVTKRIEELRSEMAGTPFADDSHDSETLRRIRDETPEEWQAAVDIDWDDVDELITLVDFAEEGEQASQDWEYGATFILDEHFEEFAEETADSIGAIDRSARWPTNCIDWKQAARELQADYTAIEVDGSTYWTRA